MSSAERKGKFEALFAAMDQTVGALCSALGGLPSRVTRDLALWRKIEEELKGALARASDALVIRAADLGAPAAATSETVGFTMLVFVVS